MESITVKSNKVFQNIFNEANVGILILDLDTLQVLEANPEAAKIHGYEKENFNKFTIEGFVQKDSLPLFKNLKQNTLNGLSFNRLAKDVREDRKIIDVEWRTTGIEFEGKKRALVFLRDVSERVKQEKHMRDSLKERVNEQDSLLKISDAMTSTMELQPSLILDQFREHIGFSTAAIISFEPDIVTVIQLQNQKPINRTLPYKIDTRQQKEFQFWMQNRKSYRIGDVSKNDTKLAPITSFLSEQTGIDLSTIRSYMWVPIVAKDEILGGIMLAHLKSHYFTANHAKMARMIANKAAMIMTNTTVFENAIIRSAYDERQRIAHNMHDAVNQSLFSAGLITEVLPTLYKKNPETILPYLEDLGRLIRGANAEMRALIAELRPESYEDRKLSELIKLQIDAFTGRTGVPIEFEVSEEKQVPKNVRMALYRISQETLNNTARHAHASRVKIGIQFTGSELIMQIEDNGCGFDKSKNTGSGHYGLAIMNERAEDIGAKLSISTQPDKGTKIVIKWNEENS